jgi:hypothetical protein
MTRLFRPAILVTAISLVLLLGYNELRTFSHPWGDLSGGTYTDHFSHMNAARAFPRVGLDIWNKPAAELSRAPTDAERAAWPDDVHPGGRWKGDAYVVDGWPVTKPWVTSWGHIPRLYPPGDMLLVAPVAFAYHFTALSLTEANRWLFTLFLIYAHVAVLFIVLGALEERPSKVPLLYVAALCTYLQIVFWTMQGFYDAAAIAPLLLSVRYLRDGRSLAAAVAYCVAAFIHFRALFFAPWALYAAWVFVQQGAWRGLRAKDGVAILVGAACAGAALTVFALVMPTLAHQDVNNPVNLAVAAGSPGALFSYAAVVIVAAGALVFARAWFDLATLAWMALMLLFVKEAHEWHILILLAWLVAPILFVRPRRDELVRGARFVMLGYVWAGIMVN